MQTLPIFSTLINKHGICRWRVRFLNGIVGGSCEEVILKNNCIHRQTRARVRRLGGGV